MALLDIHSLLFLALMALCTGFIKGGMPALGPLLSATVALWFPSREALGITLTLFLIGDSAAVYLYWRLANWRELSRMLVPLIVGIAIGGLVLRGLDNHALGLVIGIFVLLLVGLEPLRPRLTRWALANPQVARTSSGMLAGLATTISNSAGPILNIYFLVLNLDKRTFIGTATMFFAFANLAKLPIFIGQDVFHGHNFPSLLLVAPLIYLGAFAGKIFLEWISQLWFNRVVLILTAVAGVTLIINNI
ncbi:MAG: sulfite exporter TauE/SafE family protein [Gammaproteobacteria bacterium]